MSHVTRYMSHVARRTSHVAKCRTSYVACHMDAARRTGTSHVSRLATYRAGRGGARLLTYSCRCICGAGMHVGRTARLRRHRTRPCPMRDLLDWPYAGTRRACATLAARLGGRLNKAISASSFWKRSPRWWAIASATTAVLTATDSRVTIGGSASSISWRVASASARSPSVG